MSAPMPVNIMHRSDRTQTGWWKITCGYTIELWYWTCAYVSHWSNNWLSVLEEGYYVKDYVLFNKRIWVEKAMSAPMLVNIMHRSDRTQTGWWKITCGYTIELWYWTCAYVFHWSNTCYSALFYRKDVITQVNIKVIKVIDRTGQIPWEYPLKCSQCHKVGRWREKLITQCRVKTCYVRSLQLLYVYFSITCQTTSHLACN